MTHTNASTSSCASHVCELFSLARKQSSGGVKLIVDSTIFETLIGV